MPYSVPVKTWLGANTPKDTMLICAGDGKVSIGGDIAYSPAPGLNFVGPEPAGIDSTLEYIAYRTHIAGWGPVNNADGDPMTILKDADLSKEMIDYMTREPGVYSVSTVYHDYPEEAADPQFHVLLRQKVNYGTSTYGVWVYAKDITPGTMIDKSNFNPKAHPGEEALRVVHVYPFNHGEVYRLGVTSWDGPTAWFRAREPIMCWGREA